MRGARFCIVTASVAAAFVASSAGAAEAIAKVSYACAGGKTITATYYKDSVDLELSDGRKMTLPQAEAASGIRYANAGGSFVFWSKGKSATVIEGETTSYADCSELPH